MPATKISNPEDLSIQEFLKLLGNLAECGVCSENIGFGTACFSCGRIRMKK
jgi:hypothetical protein